MLCYAHLLKQQNKEKKALKILKQSLEKQPSGTSVHKRLFEMAELYDGEEAVKCFEKGIEEAIKIVKNPFTSLAVGQIEK